MNPQKRLKLIQVAKRALRLSDDDYRAILREYGGVDSAKELVKEDRAYDLVVTRFRQLGWTSTQYEKGYRRNRHSGWATAGQINLIRELWAENMPDADEDALQTWIRNRFKIENLRFVPLQKAQKIIGALRLWQERKAAKVGKDSQKPGEAPLIPS